MVLALSVMITPAIQAQAESRARGEGRRGGASEGGQSQGRGMMSPEARVEQLDRALTLTADQKKKITAIYAKSAEEMRAAMQGGGGDRDAAREKMTKIMQASREQVRALLTDEQKKKFDEISAQRGGSRGGDGQRSRGQRGGGDAK